MQEKPMSVRAGNSSVTRRRAGWRRGRALPIILAACVLVSVGAGTGIGLFMARRAQASGEAPKKVHKEPELVHSLGDMVVNLADTDSLRYAKITVALGFEKKLSEEQLHELTPAFRDTIIAVITSKRFEELHAPGGLEKAKEEIRERITARVHKHPVLEVYFEGFAMQ